MNVLESTLADRAKAIQLDSANDYRAYRHLKAKQLARTRRQLKIQVRPNKGSKSKPKSVTADLVGENVAYGQILINNAERAWAAAMESKAVQDTKQGDAPGGSKRHVISKLAKAVKYVGELIDIEDGFSVIEKLEIIGYKALLEGALRFEQKSWIKAIDAYSIARVVMQCGGSSELKRDVITSTVDPALKYAVYQSDRLRSVDVETLAKQTVAKLSSVANLVNQVDSSVLQVNAERQDPSGQLGAIKWRNHSAKVENPDLASAILAARENKPDVTKLASFDLVLQGWQDACDMVKEAIDELEQDTSRAHDSNSQQQYIVQTYINYQLLFTRIQRDLTLVQKITDEQDGKTGSKLERYRDLIRIYDTIIQSTTELRHLSGVSQDDDLQASLDSLEIYFKSTRTRLVARAYGLTDRVKSLALYKLALDRLFTAQGISVELPLDFSAGLSDLTSQLQTEITKAHGLAVLAQTAQSGLGSGDCVVNSLDKFHPDPLNKLVDFKPTLKPAPVKPVYFDIAFNYIQYDEAEKSKVMNSAAPVSSSSRAESGKTVTNEQDNKQGKKSGIFGLWRS